MLLGHTHQINWRGFQVHWSNNRCANAMQYQNHSKRPVFVLLCRKENQVIMKGRNLRSLMLAQTSSSTGSHFDGFLAGRAHLWIVTSTFSKELPWLLFLQTASRCYPFLKHVFLLLHLGVPNLFSISNMKIFCLIYTQVLKLNWNFSSEEKSYLCRFLDSPTRAIAIPTSNVERMLRGSMPSVWETGITAFLGMRSISFPQK